MKVLVNGQLIEYKKEGSGKTVLLLHGWGMSLGTFDQVAAHLVKKGYSVLRFDFPGHGSSPKPADDWGVGEYAQLTSDLLAKLKITDLYAVLGHSFGGRVIIKGFAKDLLKPSKVILIGAAGIKPAKSLKKQTFKAVAKLGKAVTSLPGLRQLRTNLRAKLYSAAGSTDYLLAGDMQGIFLRTINEDLLPEVPSIDVPTLLVWGQNDFETPVKDAITMVRLIKNAELVVVPDTGHFVYDDDFVAVKKELDLFL